jgi:two-component system KDP operon response regulator KdpE
MTTVLVVDDEPQILRALRINLRVRHYDVHVAGNGTQALEVAARHPPDLVILDLGLPDLDGVEVIEGLRGWTEAPIIVLSGRADSMDKVTALDAGADDYVTKPFSMEELLARMRAVSRRASSETDTPQVRLGDLVIDLAAKRVMRQPADGVSGAAGGTGAAAGTSAAGETGSAGGTGGRAGGGTAGPDIRLTPTEWHLLEVLLRYPGKLLSQRQLLAEVWGPGYSDATGNLRLYMAQLRRKLEPDPARPRWLLTEPGMGYRFQADPEASMAQRAADLQPGPPPPPAGPDIG